jgi:hypothetical protein
MEEIMEAASNLSPEYEIAQRILEGLPAGARARYRCEDAETISYWIPPECGLKLASIVFSKASLRALANDPSGDVKIEYEQRDLGRMAKRRKEFRFPHPHRPLRKTSSRSAFTLAPSV